MSSHEFLRLDDLPRLFARFGESVDAALLPVFGDEEFDLSAFSKSLDRTRDVRDVTVRVGRDASRCRWAVSEAFEDGQTILGTDCVADHVPIDTVVRIRLVLLLASH